MMMAWEPLVRAPIFVLTVPRSGSTLLRCIIDSHPLAHAPHELHLAHVEVNLTMPYAELAMKLLGFGQPELEYMLWDRILHHELVLSRKQVIVHKDPCDLLQWRRLKEAWPEARFIFLIRHPGAVYAAMTDAHRRVSDLAVKLREIPATGESADEYAATVISAASDQGSLLEFLADRLERLQDARNALAGLTIRYEDLVASPEQVTSEVCAFLGLPWDARMLDYGAVDHGPLIWGTGDSSDKIKSGRIVAPRAAPPDEAIPASLYPACRKLGYL
jgi:sulfotransferase family protein